MGFPTKTEVEEKARAAAYEVEKERNLVEIYKAFPTIPRNMANDQMIEEICAHFLETKVGEVAPTLSTFRSAVEADPSLLGGGSSGVSTEAVARQKLKVLEDIEKLLTGIMSPFDLRAEIKKLSFQSLEQVQARKAQIIERQRLSKLPTAEIREAIAASRPAPGRYHPYETLPADMTADELKKILRSYRANEFLRRFSAAQLNDRLFGRG
jgi:hypothetical protein